MTKQHLMMLVEVVPFTQWLTVNRIESMDTSEKARFEKPICV